jgi:predicted neuraminidase
MARMSHTTLAVLFAIAFAGSAARAQAPQGAVVKTEFIADEMPTPSCHASTIAQSGDALVCAWFGGKAEGDKSVGIWLARDDGKGWSKPVEVANGESPADAKRYPCWNPVLFQPKAGPLMLFYKVGPSPSKWWGMRMTSKDAGATWSTPERLPDGILGPIKNKPIELAGGTILCPTSTEDAGWRLHVEWTRDLGRTWDKTAPLNDGKTFGAIQPAFLRLGGNSIGLVCRSRQGKVLFAKSGDGGQNWGELEALDVPNPNSGIDAATLADGCHVMIYNDTPRGRSPLNVGLSSDGVKWTNVAALETEKGEYSYPAVIQAGDGRVHVTYTWKRLKIMHKVLDPNRLAVRE